MPPVIVVGAGPVGLVLAIMLGRAGVRCTVVDLHEEPLHLPKMERCNARTMEIFRRMGLAERIRAASFPADARMDVGIATRLCDELLVRLTYPSVAEARKQGVETDDGTLPLEPYQVVSQYTLEPILRQVAAETPGVTLRLGAEVVAVDQDDDGVAAVVRTAAGTETLAGAYLVGCDGGRSTVRKQLGIQLEGQGAIARRNQVFFRSEQLFDRCPTEQCRMYFFANADQSIITVQDDLRHFSFHTSCFGDEAELRSVMRQAIGLPIDVEILAATPWTLHLLVADRFADRRVFLAGDAVRLVIPAGGLGLNTGIGDAVDLAWKIAATVHGWGGPALLASYEAERRPVALRARDASRHASDGQLTWRGLVTPAIADPGPEGEGVRRVVAYVGSIEQRKTHEMVGTELGYRYDTSPIVVHEPGDWPPDVPEVYIPSARPGARLPHAWLADGTAVHDRLGSGYTLVRMASDAPVDGLLDAFRSRRAPVELVDLPDDDRSRRALYGADLVLVRPDLHVVWRGDDVPSDVDHLATVATGRGPTVGVEIP